jgi:ParB family chromosome partitioning protein
MENKGIVFIPAEQIYQHPDNPRKDLGDLQELSDSIRKKGIMQNLTVIPGHWDEKREWFEDGYTLIIGHRRFAAGKMAEVAEFPCRIVTDMDQKDQVGTMLEENMQRNDLTIWEQANGFQMMLDLGDTEEQIAEKTGFSKTTVKHRLNIAKLNQKVLKEKEASEEFQLSLTDLYALEQVEDIKTRDKILKEARDSRDLVWRAKSAAEETKRDKVEKAVIALLEAVGVPAAPKEAKDQMYSGKWETMESFDLDKAAPKRISKKKVEGGMYVRWYRELKVIKKKEKSKEPETEYERQQKQRKKNADTIEGIAREMASQREDVIRNIISGKIEPVKDTEQVVSNLWRAIVYSNGCVGKTSMAKFLLNTKKSWFDVPEEERTKAIGELENVSTLHQLMIAAYSTTSDLVYTDYENRYKQETGEAVKAITKALAEYGFSYSEDEHEKVLNGTHECYKKVEPEVENAADKSE